MSVTKQAVHIPLYSEVPFKYTLVMDVPSDQQITGRAYMRVYSAVGDFVYDTWDAVLFGNSFVWNEEAWKVRFIEHGARYKIWLEQTGEQDRVLAQSGKLYWSDK